MTESKELIEIEALKAVDVYRDGGVDDILAEIRARAFSFVSDMTTTKGREEIASQAYKVARTKTALDDMGKDLVADLKKRSGVIDTMRKTLRDNLDALKEEVRKPLTDFETAEKLRLDGHHLGIAGLRGLENFTHYPVTVDDITLRLEQVEEFSKRDYEEFQSQFDTVRDVAINKLSEMLSRTIKEEEDRKELERLRAASTGRELKAADDARRAAAEEQATEIKRAAEAQAATIISEAKQQAETIKAAVPTAAPAPIAAPMVGGTRRLTPSEKEARAKVNNLVKESMIGVSMGSEDPIRAIVEAMARGKIPHVTINYGAK